MKAIRYNTGFRKLDCLLTAIAYGVTSLALVTLAGLAGVLIAKFWLAN
jgi:hypothetical protein